MKNSTVQNADLKFDEEWARDWQKVVAVYELIEKLESAFAALEPDLSYLRVLTQKQLILQLSKYAWSLQAFIINKYKED